MIEITEVAVIAFLITVQSIFGVGLLLFGTPTFILLGYNFPETLCLLLPISLLISIFQFTSSKVKNIKFINDFNIFCLPFLIVALYYILNTYETINFKLYTSVIIIFFSSFSLLKNKFNIDYKINLTTKRFTLMIIGTIHGLTNLGGSLLAIFSTSISEDKKELSRYFISYGYFIMSLIQIIFLFFFGENYFELNKLYYLLIVLIIYFPAQRFFINFDNKKYSKVINILALIYGLSIFINTITN